MVGHVACDYNLPYSLIPFLLNTSQCNCIIEISLCITISPLIKKTVAFCPVAFCPVAFCPVAFRPVALCPDTMFNTHRLDLRSAR